MAGTPCPGTLRPSASSWVTAAPRRVLDSEISEPPRKAAASEAAREVWLCLSRSSAFLGLSRLSSLRASLASLVSPSLAPLASIASPPSLASLSASRASLASLLALAAPRT